MEAFFIAVLFLLILGFILLVARFFRLPFIASYVPATVFLAKCLLGFGILYFMPDYKNQSRFSEMDSAFKESQVLFNLAYSNSGDFLRLAAGWHSDSPYYDRITDGMPHWKLNQSAADDLYFFSGRNIIRIHAFLRFITGNSPAAQLVIFNFFVVSCLCFCFRSLSRIFIHREKWLFIALFLVPSTFTWSSGLFPVSLSLSLIAVAISVALEVFTEPLNKGRMVLYFLFLLIISFAFPGFMLVLWTSLLFVFITRVRNSISGIAEGIAFFALPIITFYLIDYYALNQFFAGQIIAAQQESLYKLDLAGEENGVAIQMLKNVWWSFSRNLPEAFFNAAFRPGLLDAVSPLQWLSALESLGTIFFLALAVGLYTPPESKKDILIRYFLFSTTVWFFMTSGLTSNLWSDISARRAICLPYAMLALVHVCDTDRLKAIIFEVLNFHGNNFNNRSHLRDR